MEKAEISDNGLYDIDGLCECWDSGWQEVAKLGQGQCPHKLKDSGDKSKAPLERVQLVVDEAFRSYDGLGKNLKVPKSIPPYEAILNLAASSPKKPYSSVKGKGATLMMLYSVVLGTWSKDKTKLRNVLEKVLRALETSGNYGEALSKIATKSNVTRFTDYWSGENVSWSKGEYLEHSIEPRLKEMVKWLREGLRGKQACEKAWWNCLWLYMRPTVETMLGIKKKIHDDTPLYGQAISTLNYYLQHGLLRIGATDVDDDERHKIQTILRPHLRVQAGNSPFFVMSVCLLVPPAFHLAQRLQGAYHQPRYVRKCRAPSCGKVFHTGVKTATNCPGSNRGKKNECSLEWNRYKRFIKKISDPKVPKRNWNPDSDWDNQKLKEDFIAYDNQ